MNTAARWRRLVTGVAAAAVVLGSGASAQQVPAAAMTKAATLRGDVVDFTNASIPGASVRLYSTQRVFETKTDPHGEFVFEKLTPGGYALEATSPGFTAARLNVEITDNPSAPVLMKLSLGSGGHCPAANATASGALDFVSYEKRSTAIDVAGMAHDDMGLQLAGVRVTASAAGGTQTAESNDKGEFQFVGLDPGRYTLQFSVPGHYEIGRTVWITREDTARIVVALPDEHRMPCFEGSKSGN